MNQLFLLLLLFILYLVIGSAWPLRKEISLTSEEKECLNKINPTEKSGADAASIIAEPEAALNLRLEMIKNANANIEIVMYKIVLQETGKAFFAEVLAAADRGVKVNILVNHLLYLMYSNEHYLRALQAHPNITCRVYNPLRLLKPRKLQLLMHDKIILVDEKYLLTGGRNIDERHFLDKNIKEPLANDLEIFVVRQAKEQSVISDIKIYLKKLYAYKEIVEIKQVPNKELLEELVRYQTYLQEKHPEFYLRTLQDFIEETTIVNKISLLTNPIHTEKKSPLLAYQLHQLMKQAKKTVVIQTPYLTGNEKILAGFKELVDQGISVDILTNSAASTPNFFAFPNYLGNRPKFLKTGVALFENQNLHSNHNKAITIDDSIAMIGTFNFDDRSMFLNTELMLVVYDKNFTRQLNDISQYIKNRSLKVGENNEYVNTKTDIKALKVPQWKQVLLRLCYHLFKHFEYLL